MYEAFIFLPLLALLLLAFPVLGFVAFLRTSALAEALRRAEARIAELERASPAHASSAADWAPAAVETDVQAAAVDAASVGPDAPRAPLFARIERTLASNWFVWLGGALIALAVFVLLRFAVYAGYFGPVAQLVCAYVLSAALIAAAEWLRRNPPGGALSETQLARLPAILAATGLFAWFMASLAGHAALNVFGVREAFALMALASVAAILGALRFGKWLAALGLGGGYLAPALMHFTAPAAEALFGYLLALTASALAVTKLRNWRGFIWLAAGGALAWGFAWTGDLLADTRAHLAVSLYILALALLGFAFAWSEARAPARLESSRAIRANWSQSLMAAHVLTLVVGADLLFLALQNEYEFAVLAVIVLFCALTAIVAYLREGFALAALACVALGVGIVIGWPMVGPDYDRAPAAESSFFFFCGVFGFVFSAGGWLMMTANRVKSPGAVLAAIGPLLIVLASHEKAAALRTPLLWSAAALMLAAINVFALSQLARAYGALARAPGPSAAFALGAAGGLVLAILFAFAGQPLWGAAALALMTPAIAWIDLRFNLPALRAALAVVALIVVWALGPSLEVFLAPMARTPLLNPILPVYGAASAAFWAASRIYRKAGLAAQARTRRMLDASAVIVAALGVCLEIRHLATGGDVGAAGASLGELSAYTIAWLGVALGLAVRFGAKPQPLYFWAELIALALAGVAALLGAALIENPWWGLAPERTPGWPIMNLLFAAFGIPAMLLAGYAIVRRRQGLTRRAAIAGALAIFMAFLNVTLEVRRLYHGPAMAGALVGPWEAWSYTAAWIAFAAALLALGLMRRQPSLRYASLIVLLAAIIKAIGFDIRALEGALLAAQLLGLGISVIAVTVIYQRFISPHGARDGDPNLMPPR